jgi:FkbM family methyltransferase
MTIELLLKRLSFRMRRVAWLLLKSISAPGRLYSFRLPCGARFDYPLDSAIGKYLFAGSFEPAEVRFMRERLEPGDNVLDVGANAGLYTVIAARAVGPTGHVYAFEPGARALALLRHNIAINGLDNVTVIDAAVSNLTGHASFADAQDTALSSLVANNRADQTIVTWQTVRTIRLDDAVKQLGIKLVNFVKLDVEGAEQLVLEGSETLLACAVPSFAMLFEAFDQNARPFGYTAVDLVRALQAKGFSVHGFDRSLQLQPVERVDADIGSVVYNFVAFKNQRDA